VCSECPLWVISGRFSCLPKRSAFGGKADIFQGVAKGPLIAKSGHLEESYKSEIFRKKVVRKSPIWDIKFPDK